MSTDRAEFATTGVNHAEGGWARDINPQDVEQTSRFKKKVEKDDMYMSSVLQLGAVSVTRHSTHFGYIRVFSLIGAHFQHDRSRHWKTGLDERLSVSVSEMSLISCF